MTDVKPLGVSTIHLREKTMFIYGFDDQDAVFDTWSVDSKEKTVLFAAYMYDEEWTSLSMALALVFFHQGDDLFLMEETHYDFNSLENWVPKRITLPELKKRVMRRPSSVMRKYSSTLLGIISDMEEIGVDQYVMLTRLNM